MAPEVYQPRGEGVSVENYITELLRRAEGRLFVVGFNGSTRVYPGRTRELLERSLATVDTLGGFSVIVDLAKARMDLPSGVYSKKGALYVPERRNDDVEDIRTLVRRSDGIIIATPVYWFSHSSLIQRLLEHLTVLEDYGELEGKVAGIIATEEEEGGSLVISQIMMSLTHFGMIIAPYAGIFSRGPGRDPKWVRQDVRDLGFRVVRLIEVTKGVKWDWYGKDTASSGK